MKNPLLPASLPQLYITLLALLPLALGTSLLAAPPRVFVFTDINIDAGDPDDRQSLAHLLWYANELQIEGIVPDRWQAQGTEACQLAIDAYAVDYATYSFAAKGYPDPERLRDRIASDREDALHRFRRAASADSDRPLYTLVWGNMVNLAAALKAAPELARNIRLITIGTGLMRESDIQHLPPDWEKSPPCQQMNWNGAGRNEIFNDERFDQLWWLEINWTYNGMFTGPEPKAMFQTLSRYGSLGQHLVEVTEHHPWARYFRVGDTPSVLYVIDSDHPLDDPTQASWAGAFERPFPKERPHYFTDASGDIPWNYADPCDSWEHAEAVFAHSKATLEAQRPEMYQALIEKLDTLYGRRQE